jgi:ATP-binding cassette subfamily F protein 3
MLHLKGITYTIGDRELLRKVDFIIPDGKRVALIGANGAGKTTLLRIITNEIQCEAGTMLKPNDYQIGYLPQEEISLDDKPVLDFVLQGRRDILELEKQIVSLRHQLSELSEKSDIGEKLGTLEHRFEHAGGYKLESDAKAILTGLGFKNHDFERNIQEFSGGWRMRVYLARLLLQRPNLLLLDEPTNHLDLTSLEWLEEYLTTFSGSIIVVSHDRFFIDRIAQEICELRLGRLFSYSGNYHFFEEQKEKDRQMLLKKSEHLEKERQKQQEFIDRFRYKNTKASQVQSRVKMLEKMEEVELESEEQKFSFELSVDTQSYKDVLCIENMSFRYADEWVLSELNLDLYRGEKIALVGDNGAGKTTLTKLIVDQLEPELGSIEIGKRVSIGYYAQHQVDALDVNSNIYDEVSNAVANSQIPHVRTILGLFGLKGNDVFKKIGVLSGGEKARVSLAKILLSPVNFLIMDEPTNHLDIRSKEALERALLKYDGTLVLISHDRYFLDKIVHKVVELKNGRLQSYEGNYTDYLNKKKQQAIAVHQPRNEIDKGSKRSKDDKRKQAEARQAISKKRNELQKVIDASEQFIEKLESRKDEVEAALANPDSYKDGDSAATLTKEYHQIKDDLEENYAAWERAQEELDTLLAQLET